MTVLGPVGGGLEGWPCRHCRADLGALDTVAGVYVRPLPPAGEIRVSYRRVVVVCPHCRTDNVHQQPTRRRAAAREGPS